MGQCTLYGMVWYGMWQCTGGTRAVADECSSLTAARLLTGNPIHLTLQYNEIQHKLMKNIAQATYLAGNPTHLTKQ